jgi:hypothetical protein
MKEGSHVYTSQQALGILREISGIAALYQEPEGRTANWMPSFLMDSLTAGGAGYDVVAYETGNCDHQNDVELVDVDGPLSSSSRDNPHRSEWLADDDEPHYEAQDSNFTAFSHFIDIRKGQGLYDDFDGYSYGRGSASVAQHEKAGSLHEVVTAGSATIDDAGDADAWKGLFGELLKGASNMWTDEALAWYLNDEYVHAPGQEWYRPGQCSRALERYTHFALYGPGDANDHRAGRTRFQTNEAECAARFPLGHPLPGKVGLDVAVGYPASVFAPVDNLALANWRDFEATGDHAPLGRVLHAIQDASVPHHAAGTCGNFHRKYEAGIQAHIIAWQNDPAFRNAVKSYLNMWDRSDSNAPYRIGVGDERLVPAEDWEMDQLVTWVALHAYDAYANVYRGFAGGFAFDEASARNLVVLATAMSAHVLRRAARVQGLMPRRIKVHVPDHGPVTGLGDVDVPVSDGDGGRGEPTTPTPTPPTPPRTGTVRDHRGGGGPRRPPPGDSKVDPPSSPRVRDHRHR